MAGRKVFTSGEILTAADVNSFLMDQSVMVFADSTARSSAIPTPSEGMVTYREDANRVEVYDGAAFGPIGGILQVVAAKKTNSFSTTSTSFVDITDFDLTITPSSASSKVLVGFHAMLGSVNSADDYTVELRVLRDATEIDARSAALSLISGRSVLHGSQTLLDEPSTTSAVTYRVQVKARTGTTALVGRAGTDSGAVSSTLFAMEVAV